MSTRATELLAHIRQLGLWATHGRGLRNGPPVGAIQFRATQRSRLKKLRIPLDSSAHEAIDYAVWLRYHPSFACAYCGCSPKLSQRRIDHVIALSRGGLHIATNLVPACHRCNTAKGDRLIAHHPRIPRRLSVTTWRKFIAPRHAIPSGPAIPLGPARRQGRAIVSSAWDQHWFDDWCRDND